MNKKKIVKPTASEKRLINKRLRAKYPQMFKEGWGKYSNVLKDYAKRTGGGSFAGASGSDLKELKRKFGKK